MKKLVFHYKRWYSRLITISNLFIPVFLFLSLSKHISGIQHQVVSDIKAGLLISSLGAVIIVSGSLTYILQSFKTSTPLRPILNDKITHYRPLFLGLLIHAATLMIFLLLVTIQYFHTKIDGGEAWLKYVVYCCTGITMILGVASNVFIHTFESKNYFQVFFRRHRETDVKEVLMDLELSAKKPMDEVLNRR